MTGGEKKSDSTVGENALLHGESLLVIATGDSEDVSLPLVAQRIGLNLLAHTLVVEGTNLQFIINVEELLTASGRK